MPATKITRKVYECRVCGHRWLGRWKPKPRRCGRLICRSMKWNKPTLQQVPIEDRALYACPKCPHVWMGRTSKPPTRCAACLTVFPQPKVLNPQKRRIFRVTGAEAV